MPARDIGTVTADDFEPRRGELFRLQASTGEILMTLAEVRPLGSALRQGGAFALIFVTPGAPRRPQAIYPVNHPELGTLEMFLVPIGPFAGGDGYEAVFT
jgi:hypothetical protein